MRFFLLAVKHFFIRNICLGVSSLLENSSARGISDVDVSMYFQNIEILQGEVSDEPDGSSCHPLSPMLLVNPIGNLTREVSKVS